MMRYIDKNLLPDEHVLFRTKKHLIIFLLPTVMFLLAIIFSSYMHRHYLLTHLAWAPWLVVFILWCFYGLMYWASDYAVTDKRVLMREGFFYRHTNELRLATIAQIHVDQSLLGQILNYGTISINAFGAFDRFMLIADPYRFQKTVNEQLERVGR